MTLNPLDRNIGKELVNSFPTTVVLPTIINEATSCKYGNKRCLFFIIVSNDLDSRRSLPSFRGRE